MGDDEHEHGAVDKYYVRIDELNAGCRGKKKSSPQRRQAKRRRKTIYKNNTTTANTHTNAFICCLWWCACRRLSDECMWCVMCASKLISYRMLFDRSRILKSTEFMFLFKLFDHKVLLSSRLSIHSLLCQWSACDLQSGGYLEPSRVYRMYECMRLPLARAKTINSIADRAYSFLARLRRFCLYFCVPSCACGSQFFKILFLLVCITKTISIIIVICVRQKPQARSHAHTHYTLFGHVFFNAMIVACIYP